MSNKKNTRCNCQAIIDVNINGRICSSLADAGASVTLIRSDIAELINLKLSASNLKATGVTSDSLNILGEATATVHIGNSSLSQRLFVAQNISQEVILGTDFLAKLGEVAYNFQACNFSFRGKNGITQFVITGKF